MAGARWERALQEFRPAWRTLAGVRAPFVGAGASGGVAVLGARTGGVAHAFLPPTIEEVWLPVARWVMHARLGRSRLARLPRATPPQSSTILAPVGVANLEGASFGLPFLLAQLERALGLPGAATRACTGAVNAAGEVLSVAGLEPKLRALLETTDAPLTIFVAAADRAGAARLLELLTLERQAAAGRLLEAGLARRAGPAGEALAEAWRALPWAAHRLVPIARAEELVALLAPAPTPLTQEAAAELLRASFEREPPTGGWQNFRSALDARLAEAPEALRPLLVSARDVAARHEGGVARVLPPLDAASAAGLTRRARRLVLAHRLQSCADSNDDPELERAREEALSTLAFPPHGAPDWDEADFRLAGAVGRAFASRLALEEALLWQLRALEGWREVGLGAAHSGDLSYPLCEVLRLAGALDRPDVLAAVADDLETMELHGTPVGQQHVRFARARAAVLLGAPEAATLVHALEGVEPSSHLRLAARCFPDKARELRESALAQASAEARPGLELLLRLEAVADGGALPDDAVLALLEEAARSEAQQLGRVVRLARVGRSPLEAVRYIARVFAY